MTAADTDAESGDHADPMRLARVDLAAIRHNVGVLRSRIGAGRTMAVVKARGYGHGAVPVARAALEGGADWLGVVDLSEAYELREAGIDAPLLSWLHDPRTDFSRAVQLDIDLGVASAQQLDDVARAPGRASVHIKVDTGLGRGGVAFDQCASLFEHAAGLEQRGLLTVRGIFSHLANAGEEADAAQVALFESAVGLARAAGLDPELRHLAATAGALAVPSARFDLVRLGIGVYGLSPFDEQSSADLGLKPALELSAAIVSVKRVPAGNGVSYGYTYHTSEETTLALVPLGYAEGIPRSASNRAPVSIDGRMHRIAGRVAMDQFVVDVGQQHVEVGDRAVLFGDPTTGVPSADDWARASGTINYEIVTRLGGRIERRYLS